MARRRLNAPGELKVCINVGRVRRVGVDVDSFGSSLLPSIGAKRYPADGDAERTELEFLVGFLLRVEEFDDDVGGR